SGTPTSCTAPKTTQATTPTSSAKSTPAPFGPTPTPPPPSSPKSQQPPRRPNGTSSGESGPRAAAPAHRIRRQNCGGSQTGRQPSSGPTPKQAIARMRSSIVSIHDADPDGPIGSGVIVRDGDRGIVATALHVVSDVPAGVLRIGFPVPPAERARGD